MLGILKYILFNCTCNLCPDYGNVLYFLRNILASLVWYLSYSLGIFWLRRYGILNNSLSLHVHVLQADGILSLCSSLVKDEEDQPLVQADPEDLADEQQLLAR